jgi:hypothetical protein
MTMATAFDGDPPDVTIPFVKTGIHVPLLNTNIATNAKDPGCSSF